jgi:hypothetical protein
MSARARAVTIGVLASLAMPSAHAGRARPAPPRLDVGCEILERGPYRPLAERVYVEDSRDVTGRRFEINDVSFAAQTTSIVARPGAGFGVRYQLYNLPTDRSVAVTWRVHYPRPIRGSKRWEHRRSDFAPSGRITNIVLYDFAHDWEMVAGTWRFEILVGDRSVCSQTFDVK